jgi:predicted metalloprotease
MGFENLPQSDNIEDRRGDGGGGGGPMGGGFPMGGRGGLGIGTIVILGIVGYALGIDPRLLIGGAEILSGGGSQYQQQAPTKSGKSGAPSDEMGRFVSQVLGSAEVQWKQIFEQAGMGPFYCPPDNKIYLDTSFFREIERRFQGCDAGSKACQFAQAYVIAHEVGHHVQNQLGILGEVQQRQRGLPKAQANVMQVRVELQADCLAGVWANKSDKQWNFIEPGYIEAAMRTAAAIGDDRLQKQSQGYVIPDSFTHGSSEQRQRWFMTGYKQGTVAACNTFAPGVTL